MARASNFSKAFDLLVPQCCFSSSRSASVLSPRSMNNSFIRVEKNLTANVTASSWSRDIFTFAVTHEKSDAKGLYYLATTYLLDGLYRKKAIAISKITPNTTPNAIPTPFLAPDLSDLCATGISVTVRLLKEEGVQTQKSQTMVDKLESIKF